MTFDDACILILESNSGPNHIECYKIPPQPIIIWRLPNQILGLGVHSFVIERVVFQSLLAMNFFHKI